MSRARQDRNRVSKWRKPELLAACMVLFAATLPAALSQTAPIQIVPVGALTSDAEPARTPFDSNDSLLSGQQAVMQPENTEPDSQQPAQPAQPTTQSTQSTQQPAVSSPANPAQQTNLPDAPKPAQSNRESEPKIYNCTAPPCKIPVINWYLRFEDGPQVKPLTPREKAWLATKNLIDPFNIITILGEAGISVAADSHSPYGPGFMGWERYVGVSFTEDLTGEFFGTFLIPSLVHQDPHYHRMPKASYKRRIFHAIYQVAWTEGDNGKGMLNYADLLGFGIDDEIGNLYVPGRETNANATAERYGIALATAPIGNFITEFLPDVAKHIHVQVVIVQRIINQVANKESSGT